MSINDVMKIATEGMTVEQRQEEKERRLKVVARINKLGWKINQIDIQLSVLPANYKACKIWKQKKAYYNRQIRQIKAEENAWLKRVAWFIYW